MEAGGEATQKLESVRWFMEAVGQLFGYENERAHNWIRTPLGMGKLLADKSMLWPNETEPEQNMKGQRQYWPCGKILGGSSSVNGMVFTRGDPYNYDRWRDANCFGWGYNDVLPVLKRIEHRPEGDPKFRGQKGPIRVMDLAHKDALSEAFVESCVRIGIPVAEDYNAENYEGVYYAQMSMINARRCSTEVAYLREARKRANLHVETFALTDRLLFDGDRAVGVSYIKTDGQNASGEKRQVFAAKEVILCAGGQGTPPILERSGIGDSARLEQFGISPVRHLPGVGENLQDHLNVRNTYECKLPITVNDLLNNPWRGALSGLQYILTRRGLMATPTITCFANVKSHRDLPTPDLKFGIAHVSGQNRFAMAKGLGVDPFPGFGLTVFQLHPESRGSIHIRSTDPTDPPVIHANYLGAAADQDAVVKGLEMIREIAGQDALRELIVREVRPGAAVSGYDALLDHARECGNTCWHPVSTCKMGSDQMAVIDPELKVHGVDGLRVADASVIPLLVSSNTNAPCIVIGERCAEFLSRDHG